MSERGGFCTEPMRAEDAQSSFTCGVHPLDDFFTRHAWANMKRGLGRTWVLRGKPATEEPAVLGFYTLSMAAVDASRLRPHLGGGLPRYPLPVALLGRLAVHVQARGGGVGKLLLRDALLRVLAASEHVACVGVLVDAKEELAAAWYKRLGFVVLAEEGWPRPMFLSLKPLQGLRSA
jgi:GNAT superfamily N-acetyltransferase